MSSYVTKKINNEVVREVPTLQPKDTRPIKGASLFPELCANIFLCARKKSGKTSAIFKILRRCAGPTTKILVFCSTVHKDPSWETIRAWAANKNIPFISHTSILGDDGTNLLSDLIRGMQDEEVLEPEWVDSDDETEPPKPARYQSNEWIVIFDDLSDELRKPIIATFMKKNRHFLAKVIISSQYMNDLFPQARKQLDYLILFRGHSEKKIGEIHKDVDIHIPEDEFYRLYRWATTEKYSFLYVDVRDGTFRRNFNELIEVE